MIAPNASTAAGDRAPIASVTASNLKIIGKGTLKATVDLTISRWRLVRCGALGCEKAGREWIAFPAREWTDRTGARKFANVIEFSDRETADRFRGAALAAVHALAS
jgi:hypothetical protein